MNDASNRTERGDLGSHQTSTSTLESGVAGRQSSGLERNAPEGANACEPATDASTRSERGALYCPASVESNAPRSSTPDARRQIAEHALADVRARREAIPPTAQAINFGTDGRFAGKLQASQSELSDVQERLNEPRGYPGREADQAREGELRLEIGDLKGIVAASELHDLNAQLRELSADGRFTEKLDLAKSELDEVKERLSEPRGYDTRAVDEQARSDLERAVEVTEHQISVPKIKEAVEKALREEFGDRLESVSAERSPDGTFFTFNAKIAVEKHQVMGMGRNGPHFHSYTVDRDVRVGGYNAENNKFFTNDEIEQLGEPGLVSEGLGPIGWAMDIADGAALGKLVGRAALKTVGRRFAREAAEKLGDDVIEAIGREGDDVVEAIGREGEEALAAKADDALTTGDLGSELSVTGDGVSMAHVGDRVAEGAGRKALSSAERARIQQVDQRLASLRGEISAERVRIGEIRDRVGEAGWGKVRAGETKKYYNMLEKRAVLDLQRTFPDRTFLEQVEVVGIRQPDGQLLPTGEIAGKGRVADWAEVTEHGATLGDFKSPTAVTSSVAGGMKRSASIESEFRASSTLGGQIDVERQVIDQAKEGGGQIVLRGTDPLTGETIERAVSPDALGISRVGDYHRSGAPRN